MAWHGMAGNGIAAALLGSFKTAQNCLPESNPAFFVGSFEQFANCLAVLKLLGSFKTA